MKFFADTAEVKDIQELNDLGLLDGVTTNPSLIAKSGRKFKDVIAEKHKVTFTMQPSEVSALQALRPSSVSGTLMVTFLAIFRRSAASRIMPS